MIEMYNARFVTLNVSVNNYAAVRLYRDALGFWCVHRLLCSKYVARCSVDKIRPDYYSDGSAAYAMQRDLITVAQTCNIKPANSEVFFRL